MDYSVVSTPDKYLVKENEIQIMELDKLCDYEDCACEYSIINKNNNMWLLFGCSYKNFYYVNPKTMTIHKYFDDNQKCNIKHCFPLKKTNKTERAFMHVDKNTNTIVLPMCICEAETKYVFFDFTDPENGIHKLNCEGVCSGSGPEAEFSIDDVFIVKDSISIIEENGVWKDINDLTTEINIEDFSLMIRKSKERITKETYYKRENDTMKIIKVLVSDFF